MTTMKKKRNLTISVHFISMKPFCIFRMDAKTISIMVIDVLKSNT